jgi:hypothetical protein
LALLTLRNPMLRPGHPLYYFSVTKYIVSYSRIVVEIHQDQPYMLTSFTTRPFLFSEMDICSFLACTLFMHLQGAAGGECGVWTWS